MKRRGKKSSAESGVDYDEVFIAHSTCCGMSEFMVNMMSNLVKNGYSVAYVAVESTTNRSGVS